MWTNPLNISSHDVTGSSTINDKLQELFGKSITLMLISITLL